MHVMQCIKPVLKYIRLRSKVFKNCSCSTIHNEEQENIALFHVGPIVHTMFNLIV